MKFNFQQLVGFILALCTFLVQSSASASVHPSAYHSYSRATDATSLTASSAHINAAAIAADGLTITRVDFYAAQQVPVRDDGTKLIGYTIAAPYRFTWNSAPQGNHALTIKAYNSLGQTITSAIVNITITGGPNPPTIAITAPANATTITAAGFPQAIPITITTTTSNNIPIGNIEFFDGSNPLTTTTTTGTSIYSWNALAAGVYSITAKITDQNGSTATSAPITLTITDSSGETITFLHNDFAGSAIAATDSAGGVRWKENYTPFGDRVVKAVTATNNRQWFTGKPQDSETGLSYFGARYYDPVVGRFMGIDAVKFDEKNLNSFNRFAYANNNPYMYIDPDGNTPETIAGNAHAHLNESGWGKPGWQGPLRLIPEFKCTAFINQVVGEAGDKPPMVNGRPALAGELADPKMHIPNWPVVKDSTVKDGDIVAKAFSGPGYTGHAGIVLHLDGKPLTISASSKESKITWNDFGFRAGDDSTKRRYKEEPKPSAENIKPTEPMLGK